MSTAIDELKGIFEEMQTDEWWYNLGIVGTTQGAIRCVEKNDAVLRLRKLYQKTNPDDDPEFRPYFGATLEQLVTEKFQPGCSCSCDMFLGAVAVALRAENDPFANDLLVSTAKLGVEFTMAAHIAGAILDERNFGPPKPTRFELTRAFHVRVVGPLAAEFNRIALENDWIARVGSGGPTWRDISIWEQFLPEVEKWIEEQGEAIDATEIVRKIDECAEEKN